FLDEVKIPLLIVINKIDKLSIYDKDRITQKFLRSAREFELNVVHLNNLKKKTEIPYLEFSALKKQNLKELKKVIQNRLKSSFNSSNSQMI
ncbi:MAG: hypothetical protein ACW972_09695, partial [Promethearchaeota archaeon]